MKYDSCMKIDIFWSRKIYRRSKCLRQSYRDKKYIFFYKLEPIYASSHFHVCKWRFYVNSFKEAKLAANRASLYTEMETS